ncbi:MAG: hypothetical protein KJO13_07790, partial [Gammaproteobacteria bacterium]|nr:hypothetical protein [Gammaproteobacteria bacterium]
PWGISLDPQNRVAYVADGVADTITSIDLTTGDRRLLAGNASGQGTIASDPIGVAHDPATGDVYIADFTLNSLSTISAAGTTRVISDATTGSGPLLENPYDIELDLAGGVAYVLDSLRHAVFSIDLADGARRIVSAQGIGAGPAWGNPQGLDLDAGSARLFVADADCIYSVAIQSGDRTIVSCNGVGVGQGFRNLGDIAFDPANERVLGIDDLRNVLFSVDLATGDREIISGDSSLVLLVTDPDTGTSEFVDVPRVEGGGLTLAVPRRIDFDPALQIAYITDDAYDGVIAVDVASGYRQLIAK